MLPHTHRPSNVFYELGRKIVDVADWCPVKHRMGCSATKHQVLGRKKCRGLLTSTFLLSWTQMQPISCSSSRKVRTPVTARTLRRRVSRGNTTGPKHSCTSNHASATSTSYQVNRAGALQLTYTLTLLCSRRCIRCGLRYCGRREFQAQDFHIAGIHHDRRQVKGHRKKEEGRGPGIRRQGPGPGVALNGGL